MGWENLLYSTLNCHFALDLSGNFYIQIWNPLEQFSPAIGTDCDDSMMHSSYELDMDCDGILDEQDQIHGDGYFMMEAQLWIVMTQTKRTQITSM